MKEGMADPLRRGATPPSPIGRQLGAYRIDALIGAGGMGEVYRAADTRLGRGVAVKILPAAWAADPDRRSRFEREARAVAALNHPNICTIHDVGHDQGIDFLVMELLEGESLAARLTRGPLPFEHALARAIEIADALDQAHRQGIIHRDLKPANVMLLKAGSSKAQSDQAKLLDFGLARIVPSAELSVSAVPTQTTPMTEAGGVFGTPHYMAPEQIEGRPADPRTDIFAFGALLYEMLAGRRAFEGASTPAVMAAILRGDAPSLESLKPPPPRALERLVQTCLAKDPDDRYSTMHDVLLALRGIVADARTPVQPASVHAAQASRWPWLLLAGGLAAVVGVAGFWLGALRRPVSDPGEQTSLDLVPPQGTSQYAGLALSPDGRTLAAVAFKGPSTYVWIRHLWSQENQRLAGTDNGVNPFWSPDGRSIAFFADGHLKRMDVAGGKPFAICPASDGRGGAWFDDGTIVFAPDANSGLMRVRATGGDPVLLAPPDKSRGEISLRHPAAIGRRRLMYLAQNADATLSELRLLNLDAPGQSTSLVRSGTQGVFANGRIFYERQGVVVAQSFNDETGTMTGEPTSITSSVTPGGTAQILFSASARSIAWWTTRPGLSQLKWIARSGGTIGALGDPEPLGFVDLSPDDRLVAFVKTQPGGRGDIWILDTASGASQRLVDHHATDVYPLWSPDGSRLAFQSSRGAGGSLNLYAVSAGGGAVQTIAEAPRMLSPAGWTPDGRTFAWVRWGLEDVGEVNTLQTRQLDAAATHTQVLAELPLGGARVSPDGTMIAYWLREVSQYNLYVDRFPALGSRQLVARRAGTVGRWRADSRELFFVLGNNIVAAAVRPGGTPTAASPATLFPSPGGTWDVTHDGSRFLFAVPTTETLRTISVIQNWSPDAAR